MIRCGQLHVPHVIPGCGGPDSKNCSQQFDCSTLSHPPQSAESASNPSSRAAGSVERWNATCAAMYTHKVACQGDCGDPRRVRHRWLDHSALDVRSTPRATAKSGDSSPRSDRCRVRGNFWLFGRTNAQSSGSRSASVAPRSSPSTLRSIPPVVRSGSPPRPTRNREHHSRALLLHHVVRGASAAGESNMLGRPTSIVAVGAGADNSRRLTPPPNPPPPAPTSIAAHAPSESEGRRCRRSR